MCTRQALNKEQRWGSALLSRHQSLEEEFERAKAAVEVSTACTACTSQPSHFNDPQLVSSLINKATTVEVKCLNS